MSNILISHALEKPLKLIDHINQVIKASKYLLSQKIINFVGLNKTQIEEIITLIAISHDFGKSTIFFQDYIQSKIDGNQYMGNEKDKSHSLISGLLGWYLTERWVKKNGHIENRWKIFLPFAVLLAIEGHHGSYNSIEGILRSVYNAIDSGLLYRQLDNIQPEIFTYEFGNYKLKDGEGFSFESIKLILEQLRNIHRQYGGVSLDNQLEQRILGLFLYSILLEADKAYLASDNPEQYERETIVIPDDIVDKFIKSLDKKATINKEREKAYITTIKNLERFPLNERIHSITLPTGLGKTLLSASWAIKLRSRLQKTGMTPKIIVALPFLSIIEQTDDVYTKILGDLYIKRADRLYTTRYSIADFKYKDGIDKEERSDNSTDFFLSIWNSELVVTTFDQLLYSVFSLKSKHLMRFHNLFNSILVFDEIQALPTDLWKPFELFFKKLSEVGNTHIVLMSATQPGFFPGAIERVPEHAEYFKNRKRVNCIINHEQTPLEEFNNELLTKLDELFDKSVMIVLNTRSSSKQVYESIENAMDKSVIKKRPLIYLSSYVTPLQRIERIRQINKYLKKLKNTLVITTQCIEAGVDIDMDYIIRDWGPLDSIFQVCGRCNRNGEKSGGTVEIIYLLSEKNKPFSSSVYDDKLLECTAFSLNNSSRLSESQFYDYGTTYFNAVRERLGHSMKIVKAFAQYSYKYIDNGREVEINIKKLLRGDEWQEQFIISSLDTELIEDIKSALEINDRWKRRYALKRLSKRIAENSINLKFEKWMPNRPDDFADYSIGNFWILDEELYDKDGVGFTADISKQIGGLKFF